jgi:transglutaminase-like putative cysteine protease
MKYLYIIALLLFINNIFASNNEIVSFETHLKIDDENNLIKTVKVKIIILNSIGESLTNVEIPYTKDDVFLYLKAWLEDSNGKIVRKLKKSEFTDKSFLTNSTFYNDILIKDFSLKSNSFPYYINYEYSLKIKYFFNIINWFPVISVSAPTKFASLILEIPKNYKIKIQKQFINYEKIDSTNNNIKYEWKSNYLTQLSSEIFSADIESYLPKIAIVPQNFKYGINGSFKSWISYGNWQYNLIKDLNILPSEEKQIILEMIKNITDIKEKVRTLYHYLQDNTRYINVAIEIGGLKPYSASYVAVNKFGDCKALTNYMKSMLDIIGVKSYYTNIYAGNNIKDIKKDFPSQQFNHAILMVLIDSDTVWLECTDKFCPFGYVGTFIQNRDVFVIDENNSFFTKTPLLNEKDVQNEKKITFNIDNFYNVTAFVNFKLKGDDFETYKYINSSFNNHQKNKIFDYILPFQNYEILNSEIITTNRDSAYLILDANIKLSNYAKNYNNIISFPLFQTIFPDFEKPSKRKLDAKIDYPISSIDTLLYNIPSGYISKQSYETELITLFGLYSIKIKSSEKYITVIKKFTLFSGRYTIEQYLEFYSFLQEVKKIENTNPIIFKKI